MLVIFVGVIVFWLVLCCCGWLVWRCFLVCLYFVVVWWRCGDGVVWVGVGCVWFRLLVVVWIVWLCLVWCLDCWWLRIVCVRWFWLLLLCWSVGFDWSCVCCWWWNMCGFCLYFLYCVIVVLVLCCYRWSCQVVLELRFGCFDFW